MRRVGIKVKRNRVASVFALALAVCATPVLAQESSPQRDGEAEGKMQVGVDNGLGYLLREGVPYSSNFYSEMREISGGTPYGASTLAGADRSRMPSESELAGARLQGRHVAEIAKKLAG